MRKRILSCAAALALFVLLLLHAPAARAGVLKGWALWTQLLLPSLLPFFVCAGLLTRLGIVSAVGRRLSPLSSRLLGISGTGAGIFLLGLSGGYPLGAASAAEAVRAGSLSREEAERLLRFCDNTGPAFAVGALGAGVFHSAVWGLVLWGIHALSAFILGLWQRGDTSTASRGAADEPASPAQAFTASVLAAGTSILSIGGYVLFFSALLGVAGELGFPDGIAVLLQRVAGGELSFYRALLTGALELSSGMGAMAGLPLTPANLALGSFLLGWGGLCVHLQSAAVTAGTGISLRGRLRGKLLHGLLSAVLTYFAAALIL